MNGIACHTKPELYSFHYEQTFFLYFDFILVTSLSVNQNSPDYYQYAYFDMHSYKILTLNAVKFYVTSCTDFSENVHVVYHTLLILTTK